MSSKKSTSSKKKDKKEKSSKKKPKTPSPEPEAYEDDFENYDDDFEDDDEKEETVPIVKPVETKKEEIKAVAVGDSKHVDDEYEGTMAKRLQESRIRHSEQPKQNSSSNVRVPKLNLGGVSNFEEDSNSYQTFSPNFDDMDYGERKAMERFQKLRGLITIETTKTTIFTDLSANIFGTFSTQPSNLVNAYCQTSKDCKHEEIQTETGEMESKETQFPHIDNNFSNVEQEKTAASRSRFKKFFFAATQTMHEILMNDDEGAEEDEIREKSTMKFTRGYNQFQLRIISNGCKATCIHRGEIDTVLVAYEIFETPAIELVNRSLIVESYIHKKSRPPKRLFVTQSVVVAMEMSTKTSILYVALLDGTLCAFDLTEKYESCENGLPWVESKHDIDLRLPSFDSSFLAPTLSDASSIVGLAVTQSQAGDEVITIDASGTVTYWQSGRIDNNEISVQLTALIRPHPVLKRHTITFAVSSFCPIIKPFRFIIGTDTGILYSMYKSDTSSAIPKIYKTEKEKYGEISAIAHSPFEPTVLLVGFASGGLAIYRTTQTSPILYLPKTETASRVSFVFWDKNNPSAFYSIAGGRVIMYWDLSHSTTPRTVDHMSGSASIVACHCWQSETTKMIYMGISMDNGDAEVHVLETPQRKNPNETLLELLNRLRSF